MTARITGSEARALLNGAAPGPWVLSYDDRYNAVSSIYPVLTIRREWLVERGACPGWLSIFAAHARLIEYARTGGAR